jgi:hypothetical protein
MSSTVTLGTRHEQETAVDPNGRRRDEHAAPPAHRLGVEADHDDHHLSPLLVAPALLAGMTASDRRGAA